MTLSNSPCLGSRGILTDWEMHTPPEHTQVYRCQYDLEILSNTFTRNEAYSELNIKNVTTYLLCELNLNVIRYK